MSSPLLRFAPSPNGRLHLGHAYSALFTADGAARLGGRFLLRIEDIDLTRCKPEFTEAIFTDLKWLGLSWPEPVLRQSERFALYAGFGARLKGMGLLYPCFCSRSEIAATAQGTDPDGASLYPGTCRHLSDTAVRERLDRGEQPQWRLRSDAAIAKAGPLTYRRAQPTPEQLTVEVFARPERWGDVVLQRKDTPTSYHLSVVVDDEAQGITHVTRGRDMEAATDIHVLLQALLEFNTPVYSFHELLLDEEGRKLAKSRGSKSLADLRAGGWTAEGVRGRLGF
jgi:glutamyl-Q tRNA(Asp) synthetase